MTNSDILLIGLDSEDSSIGYDFIDDASSKIDYTLIQYISSHQHLNCPICQLPFFDPYSTLCGHTFCHVCLEESLKMTGMKCPLDRNVLDFNSEGDVFPSPIIIKNLIDELMVKCLNEKRGCNWKGQRWEIKNHLVSDCKYTRFKCNFDEDCSRLTERRFLDEADNQCVHKLVICECGSEMMKYKIKNHLETECQLITSQCNGCNLSFTRREIKEHELCCEKQYVKCQASKFGCDWKGTRLLLETVHQRNCQFIKLSSYLEEQDSKLYNLSETNKSLQAQVSTILDSVIQGKVTNLGYGLIYDEVGSTSLVRDSSFSGRGNNVRGSSQNDDAAAAADEDERIQLFMEMGNLKEEMAKLEISIQEQKTNVLKNLINDNMRMKDELNFQKNSVTSIRQQIHFLMMERRRSNSFSHGYSSHSSDDENYSTTSLSGIKL